MNCTTLESYMQAYGHLLGDQATRSIAPLHDPAKDGLLPMETLRAPYEPQAHVITAGVKTLRRQRSLLLNGEMGVGKSLCGQLMCHAHAGGKPYYGMIFCPPHLCDKWERELRMTIPGVRVRQIRHFRDLIPLRGVKPTGPEWCIVSQSTAKLGTAWKPAYRKSRALDGICLCPSCGVLIEKETTEDGEKIFVPVDPEDLAKNRLFCQHCKSALWQYIRKPDRWPAAIYTHKKLKGVFRYLIADEAHQSCGEDTATANSLGSLAAACRFTVAMTGTLINGYANSLRTMLLRLAPRSLVDDGFGWADKMPFNERYGRIERRVTTKESRGPRNSYSRGSQRTTKYVRPGVMPTLFGDHLIDKTIFLGLADVADNLPELDERVIPVDMDAEQREAYDVLENALASALKSMVARGDKRLLGAMVQALICYPDRPYGWREIGYYQKSQDSDAQVWIPVVTPKELNAFTVRPKERALVDQVLAEVAEGRQVWVFSTMSDTRDVLERLRFLLSAHNLRVKILRSGDVETREREAWIAKHGPEYQVVLSHPELVETGLDLLDREGTYNFSTLMFFLGGYALNTLRQASRRHWRLIQKMACRTYYLFYAQSMQDRAMTLMAKKLSAAEALEGKFSSEGLAALSGDEGSMELALAKSLVDKLDDCGAAQHWNKVAVSFSPPPIVTEAPAIDPPAGMLF